MSNSVSLIFYLFSFNLLFNKNNGVIYSWSECSAISQFNCTCHLQISGVTDLVLDEDTVGGPVRCSDYTESCNKNIMYGSIYRVLHITNINIKLAPFLDKLTDTTWRAMVSLTSISINGSLYCTIRPGYEAKIINKPEYLRVDGNIIKLCPGVHFDMFAYDEEEEKSNTVVYFPKILKDGQPIGVTYCQDSPIANMTSTIKGGARCNVVHLSAGAMTVAVEQTLNKVLNSIRINGSKAYEFSNITGHEVWASGECFNGIDRHVCAACYKILQDNIWDDCEHAIGAQNRVHDCYLRYETYEYEPHVYIGLD